jgi:hypothetical protein
MNLRVTRHIYQKTQDPYRTDGRGHQPRARRGGLGEPHRPLLLTADYAPLVPPVNRLRLATVETRIRTLSVPHRARSSGFSTPERVRPVSVRKKKLPAITTSSSRSAGCPSRARPSPRAARIGRARANRRSHRASRRAGFRADRKSNDRRYKAHILRRGLTHRRGSQSLSRCHEASARRQLAPSIGR